MTLAFTHLVELLFQLAALGIWLLAAIVLLVWGSMRRDRWLYLVFGLLMLALPSGLLVRSIWLGPINMDLTLEDRWVLVGRWEAKRASLELRRDGTFALQAEGEVARRLGVREARGVWSLIDWNFVLVVEGGEPIELRLIEQRGQYRLNDDVGDPDNWRWWRGFERVDEASGETPP